jgi:hypothetical protein
VVHLHSTGVPLFPFARRRVAWQKTGHVRGKRAVSLLSRMISHVGDALACIDGYCQEQPAYECCRWCLCWHDLS